MTIQFKKLLVKWLLAIVIMAIAAYLCYFVFNLGLLSIVICAITGSIALIVLKNRN